MSHFLLRPICWVTYWFRWPSGFDGHHWKLERELTTENDAEELEALQAEANKHTTLQILTPHYMEIFECRVCGARQSESGWNDMVAYFPGE